MQTSERSAGSPEARPDPAPWRPWPSLAAIGALRLLLMLLLALSAAGAVFWYLLEGDRAEPLREPDLTLVFLFCEIAFYGLLALLLWLACRKAGIVRHLTLGALPGKREAGSYLLLGIPMVALGIAGFYVLFLPLSFVFPDFVSFWLLDVGPMFLLAPQPKAILADLLTALTLVVLAPVIEEVFFRGFLLNALWRRYGFTSAVVISSLIFAIPHGDILGAFVFAVVLSIVLASTRSLIGPMLVHASNNAIVVLLALVEGLAFDKPWIASSLEGFRTSWWLAPLGAAIALPWLWYFLRRLPRPGAVPAVPEDRRRGPAGL